MGNSQSQNRGNTQQNNQGSQTPKENKVRPQSTQDARLPQHPKPKRRGTRLELPDLTPSSPPSDMLTQPIPVPGRDRDNRDEIERAPSRGRPRSRDQEGIKGKSGERERKDRTPTAPSKGKESAKPENAKPNDVLEDTELGPTPSYHIPLTSLPVADTLNRYDSRDGKLRRKPLTGAERAKHRSKGPFTRTVVRSSVPTGLRRVEKRTSGDFKIPTTITWRNTAKQVFVTGSFSSVPWRQRIPLQTATIPAPSSTSTIPKFVLPPAAQKDAPQARPKSVTVPGTPTKSGPASPVSAPTSPNPLGKTITIHQTTVPLSPGTHRLKFMVDGVYMCSDELPTASDEDGTLVNVIEVGEGLLLDRDPLATSFDLGGGEAIHTNPHLHPSDQLNPPEQFWSSDEEYTSASEDDNDSPSEIDTRSMRSSFSLSRRRANKRSLVPKKTSTWTTVVPSELDVAVKIEEEYLQASAKHHQHPRSLDQRSLHILYNAQHLLPPAPMLPHFLNNVILNPNYGGGAQAPIASSAGLGVPSTSSSSRRNGKETEGGHGKPRGRNPPSPTPIPAYIATNAPMPLAVKPRLGQGAVSGDVGKHDDASVLPTPSHVVLNHLATGAIKGGVLACAGTVRYGKKCITTVYYKPTSNTSAPPLQAQGQEEQL